MNPAPGSLLLIDASPFSRSLVLLPMVRAIRAAYPHTFIAVAATKGVCELITSARLADETIDLGVIKRSGPGAIKRLFQLVKHTRRDGFDLAVDVSPRIETQLPSRFLLRARLLTPLRLAGVVDSLLGRGGSERPDTHLSECKNVLKQMGLEMKGEEIGIEIPAEENLKFEQLLTKSGSQGGEPLTLLYSANADPARGWSPNKFGEIGERLANNFGARIVAADEPADQTFTRAVGDLLPKGAIKLAEPGALQLAAAIARASVVITDDPGLARLAVDLHTPVVEVSSGTAAPLSEFHQIVSSSSRAAVPTDEVFIAACAMLKTERSRLLFRR
ncbi:MAG TPA: hypothetical protein VNO70_04980 [Blastocatellia bacterium]|nr:hypothetical protein [Blastocatellia bacterium]